MRSRSPWLLNGFSMKSKAPCWIAWTAIGISPWAVKKIIGTAPPRCASSAWSSMPLMPGMRTSLTMQPGTEAS